MGNSYLGYNWVARCHVAAQTVLVLTLAAQATAHTRPLADELRESRAQADASEKIQDWRQAEASLNECLRLAPDNPGLLIRLARADIGLGAIEDARRTLERYATLGMTFDASKQEEIAALLATPQLARVAASMRENARVIGHPRLVAALGRGPIVAEGIAFDPIGQRLLVSAVAARTIYAVHRGGGIERFLAAGASVAGLFGMAIDAGNGMLWVAEAAGPGIPGNNQIAATALIGIELVTGKISRRLSVPQDGISTHQLNDVVVASDHTVFAADAEAGEIYRLAPAGERLDVFVAKGHIWSAQGMVISEDGSSLIIADYGTGLRRVDLKTRAITLLHSRAPAALVGIDGLTVCDGALIATQNGTTPERILQIRLDARADSIRSVRVLAQNSPGVHDITLGTCTDHRYLYLSNSQWEDFNANGDPVAANYSPAAIMQLSPRR
jgi:hypothetical protein